MLKITHSLLASWQYAISEDAREDAYDSFLATLRGERTEPTEAMLKGREFEDDVNYYVANGILRILDSPQIDAYLSMGDTHIPDPPNTNTPYWKAVHNIGDVCVGGQPQVKIEKEIACCGTTIRLVGVLDYLKAGAAYDIKRTSKYEYGKYQHSTQHPMYFRLVPEATRFVYLIYDGYRVYTEDYWADETSPIDATIIQFIDFLRANDLLDVYMEHWKV